MTYPPPKPSPWKPIGIAVAVIALVGLTFVTLIGIGLVMSMRNFGSNK